MLQTWSRNSIWIHARHESMTNPWYFSYDDIHMSWIHLHPCMLSNPCRYLDESKSMRLQLTHILSNLYITKSLHNGGWWQGIMKSFDISFDKLYISNFIWYQVSWLSFWIHKCSSLQKLTHVGRWTHFQVVLPTLDELHQPRAIHTSSTTWLGSTPPPKVCHSILEKLNLKW